MKVQDLTVVICCHRKDFFFARLCAMSVRYYYPDIAIELVKDPKFGKFDSTELQRTLKVKPVDLGIPQLGWSGAKFHYLYQTPPGKKVLLLDADIVFAGPFLERLLKSVEANDYVVSADFTNDPYSDYAKTTYFDVNKLKSNYPDYEFPGYFFNAGQIFVTIGSVPPEVLDNFFDRSAYPFWKHQDIFPLVDQSVYNYLLPTRAKNNGLKLGIEKFMLWSLSEGAAAIELPTVVNKNSDAGLIHWAGDKRNAAFRQMSNRKILCFFEDEYYSRISNGKLLHKVRKLKAQLNYLSHTYYYKLRKLVAKVIKK